MLGTLEENRVHTEAFQAYLTIDLNHLFLYVCVTVWLKYKSLTVRNMDFLLVKMGNDRILQN